MKTNDLKTMVNSNEKIIWEGRPDRKVFILESIFNPFLPFALIWALFDSFAISQLIHVGDFFGEEGLFMFFFFALHLMPVWIYLAGALFSIRKYRNTYYIITDAGVYTSGGTFTRTYQMKPFTNVKDVNLHRGIIDQWLGVGDITIGIRTTRDSDGNTSTFPDMSLINLADYEELYKLIKGLQRDVYSDTMYPNDLRPKTNHGYKTDYQGKADRR